MERITIPALSLVVLVGVSGSGKSSFARKHFLGTEVISSDFCRGLVSDDENDQAASKDAFEVLHFIAAKRLAAGRLTVIDATNVQPEARKQLVALAREYDVLPVAIVLDVPERVAVDRNALRPDRQFGAHVVQRQRQQLRRGLRSLKREGFRNVQVLGSVEEIDAVTIDRTRLFNDLTDQTGPFDIIGDIHGCRAELEQLLTTLGYTLTRDPEGRAVDATYAGRTGVGTEPAGRRVVFVGDLVDRGPDTPGVLRLVMGMVASSNAYCVPGNHEDKLLRALRGKKVKVSHGLAESLEQLAAEPEEFRAAVETFIDGLISHYVFDRGNLVVSHAGLVERMHGRTSGRVRAFCLYGETTGETDEYGLPMRYPWANDYRGRAMVVYGHTPTPVPEWINNTICLDTGCVFGGSLTALRYPDRELVSVDAFEQYYEPAKPLQVATAPGRAPDVLDITDVTGRRVIETATHGRLSIRAEQAGSALEVMSRFAIDPRFLLYLPPTMSPVATSPIPGVLEHPTQAFEAYKSDGVTELVCEEKHMGSRAVVLVTRDDDVAEKRFGLAGRGAVHTRTGRSFFDTALTDELLLRLRAVAEAAGLFEELDTSWLLLDAELLPWSAKAIELLKNQYAAVGAAARTALPAATAGLESAVAAGLDVGDLLARTQQRTANADLFSAAYRRYCWPTEGLDGVRIAPFQVLASEGATYEEKPHAWHLSIADRLVAAGPTLITPTRRLFVDLDSWDAGTAWWEELTAAGGEGMVVKPAANLIRTKKGLAQPGLKVRGQEYLRIIYGPDYTEPANFDRLRQPKPRPQTLNGPPRIRPRPGVPGTGRPRRTAVAHPRMRLLSFGPGVRTSRPAPLDRIRQTNFADAWR
ncbi:polynucleotide kinase-phosphatase [Kribbella qitaiheensis]|uniref:polynucleotide kinase-phosphatase n=1 Tax=Kribbella qitaiheensis TaxID=1544730 RepID=UPI003D18949A